MALLVQKFGGSSVADAEKILNVARRVAASAPGNQMIVVVSAMGKTTDGLLALSRQISPTPPLRELDTIALVALALQSLGLKARSFTGPQVGMRTDHSHTQARITQIDGDRVRRAPAPRASAGAPGRGAWAAGESGRAADSRGPRKRAKTPPPGAGAPAPPGSRGGAPWRR